MSIEGVQVELPGDGRAYIEFLDKSIRGAVIGDLAEAAGPHGITTDSGGTRKTYIVSEEVARQVGLIEPEDAPEPQPTLAKAPTTSALKGEWEAWLDQNELAYPTDATKADLINIWEDSQKPPVG